MLVAEVFEKNGLTDTILPNIRIPLNAGIAGHVATSGQMLNVKDAYRYGSVCQIQSYILIIAIHYSTDQPTRQLDSSLATFSACPSRIVTAS